MKSRHLIVPSFFLLFLVSGYVIAGFARHYTYEEVMKEHEARMITLRKEGVKKPMDWEDYEYVGNPEAASVIKDPVFQEEIRVYLLCDNFRWVHALPRTEIFLYSFTWVHY